jgi:hypothetical protein
MSGFEIEDCVTMAQFNELKQSLEDKQDRLSRDFWTLMAKIRDQRQPRDGVSNHGEDANDIEEEAVARLAREQRRSRERAVVHARRPPPLGHRGGGRGTDHDRGSVGLE